MKINFDISHLWKKPNDGAKLPVAFENQSQLLNMRVGESVYIVPWGMWVDMDGNCYLNEKYDIHPGPSGTVQLKITKIENGYIVHLKEMNGDYKWERQEGPTYATPNEFCYGKVVGFDRSFLETFFN